MKIIVTGGAGYIGLHLIQKLLDLNNDIFVVDDFSTSDAIELKKVELITNKCVNYAKININRTKKLIDIFKEFNPDLVVHLAGFKFVNESISNPMLYYQNNLTGTISLLKSMEEVNCNNILFSSSATVYGEPKYLPYDENHPKNPTNPYGNTKWIIEKMLMDWSNVSNSRTAISLRYFNPVGAHKSKLIGEKYDKFSSNIMPAICNVILGKSKNLFIYGNDYDTKDGTAERDYIHILDLTNAHVKAIDYLMKTLTSYDVFNIGTNKPLSVLELVNTFEKTTKIKIPIIFKKRRKGDLPRFWANSKKAKKILNWSPKLNHEDICKDTWNYLNEKIDRK